uniref:Uncharacterized protein n=1 Tax=Arundo donax TaxID=35708 RepID=A0A0A8YF01_ARUDO
MTFSPPVTFPAVLLPWRGRHTGYSSSWDKEAIRVYLNSTGFKRWHKIYGSATPRSPLFSPPTSPGVTTGGPPLHRRLPRERPRWVPHPVLPRRLLLDLLFLSHNFLLHSGVSRKLLVARRYTTQPEKQLPCCPGLNGSTTSRRSGWYPPPRLTLFYQFCLIHLPCFLLSLTPTAAPPAAGLDGTHLLASRSSLSSLCRLLHRSSPCFLSFVSSIRHVFFSLSLPVREVAP